MTLEYWQSLDESCKRRTLRLCWPTQPQLVQMLLEEAPDLNNVHWVATFKMVKIPPDGSNSKVMVGRYCVQ